MVVPVDSQNGVRKYVWNNSTTEFSYPYIITSDSLYATLYDDNGELILEIPSTAYTLSDDTRSSGVLTITDSTVLATEADIIILERIEELNQDLDLGKRDFPPQDIEDAFDKSRIIDQQQQSLANRGVITNITEDREEPIELPVAVQDLFLAWDADGNLKNATSTGTALPTVSNTYLKRNDDNDAFDVLTVAEMKTDLGIGDLVITDGSYIRGNGTGYDELTGAEVSADLGGNIELPINDTVTYIDTENVTWYGACRSDDNTSNLIVDSGSPVTGTLVSGVVDTTYHLFVGYNGDTTPIIVAEFTTDETGATGLTNIVGAKRRVVSVLTDSSGDIIEPYDSISIGNDLYYHYNEQFFSLDYAVTGDTSTTLSLTAPVVSKLRPILSCVGQSLSAQTGGSLLINNQFVLTLIDMSSGSQNTVNVTLQNIITSDATVQLDVQSSPTSQFIIRTVGYIDRR